jgi:hypothetical protein
MPPTTRRAVQLPVLGPHPSDGVFHDLLTASDAQTTGAVPYRSLGERAGARATSVPVLRRRVAEHHANAAALVKSADIIEALKRQGVSVPKALRRFPVHPETRRGNFAEILLADYVEASTTLRLPVYRLRHNPNIDQSMKGDDVLAFDLDANPVRIIVGEAKFRGLSTSQAVNDIIDALERSFAGGLPASLLFVADHVDDELSERIMACATLFAEGKLDLSYVGLLMSDTRAHERVAGSERRVRRRLMMLSLGVADPTALVDQCFSGLV